jgi:ribosomal protein S18 acetylase RimI-like enzyme
MLQAETAQIAQVAIDPTSRRRGLARDLIETSCALAAASGYRRMTLLVAEDNAPARTLYEAAGFTPLSHFLYATRNAPTRMRGARVPATATANTNATSPTTNRPRFLPAWQRQPLSA